MSSQLNALIRATINEHPNDTHEKIARLVAENTPAEHAHEYYVQALEPLVADSIRLKRNATLNSNAARSAKLAERRNWWQRVLAERVHVGQARYKPIGACTVGDLDFCISERRDQIGKLSSQIAKYEAIKAAMITLCAETAADLPNDAVTL